MACFGCKVDFLLRATSEICSIGDLGPPPHSRNERGARVHPGVASLPTGSEGTARVATGMAGKLPLDATERDLRHMKEPGRGFHGRASGCSNVVDPTTAR